MKFYRSEFNEVCLTLKSNEALGMLDTSYIEDYYGNDGYISIQNKNTLSIYQLGVSEVLSASPDIPNDSFRGCVSLTEIPNGQYRLMGRLKDLLNNYSIIGDVLNPIGIERIFQVDFEVLEGNEHIIDFGMLTIEATYNIQMRYNSYTPVWILEEQAEENNLRMELADYTTNWTLEPVTNKILLNSINYSSLLLKLEV